MFRVLVVSCSTVALLDIRQRAGYLFLVVSLGHVILISTQVNSQSGVPVLESVTFGFFAEVPRSKRGTFVFRFRVFHTPLCGHNN